MQTITPDNDPPLNAREALMDTLNKWRPTMPHLEASRLAEAIARITLPTPGWPIATVAEKVA